MVKDERASRKTRTVESLPGFATHGFRLDLLEIFEAQASIGWILLRYDNEREPPREESEAMKSMRAWRAAERKTMVESIEKLIGQANRMALSRYTRSAQRAKWTRLAGQLIWYKDQILRAMTWEALDVEVKDLVRKVFADEEERKRAPMILKPPTWAPTVVKKLQEEVEERSEELDDADTDSDSSVDEPSG